MEGKVERSPLNDRLEIKSAITSTSVCLSIFVGKKNSTMFIEILLRRPNTVIK